MQLPAIVVAIDDRRLPVERVGAAERTLDLADICVAEPAARRQRGVVLACLRNLVLVVAHARDDVERVAEMKGIFDRDRPRILSLLLPRLFESQCRIGRPTSLLFLVLVGS